MIKSFIKKNWLMAVPFALLAFMVAPTAGQVSTDLVTNGEFENFEQPILPGWNTNDPCGEFEVWIQGALGSPSTGSDGLGTGQHLELNNMANITAITQSFVVPTAAGNSATFSFDAWQRKSGFGTYSVTGSVSGAVISEASIIMTTYNWTKNSQVLNVIPGETITLSFVGKPSHYQTPHIDQVSFVVKLTGETEPNNEYGDPNIVVIYENNTFKGEVKKRSDYSDLWYIKAGSSGPLTLKNVSDASVWMDVSSFSNNYGGPGNMIKHIVRLRPGSSRQVNLNSERYYVVNAYVPFRSTGGSYKFTISGDWTAPVELTKEKAELENNKDEHGEIKTTPEAFNLYQNYPNPFNPSTEIVFNLEQESDVSLKIYNVSGQLVSTLVSGHRTAGIHRVTWDATDENGLKVASGVYIAVVRAGDMVAQTKMMFAK